MNYFISQFNNVDDESPTSHKQAPESDFEFNIAEMNASMN